MNTKKSTEFVSGSFKSRFKNYNQKIWFYYVVVKTHFKYNRVTTWISEPKLAQFVVTAC